MMAHLFLFFTLSLIFHLAHSATKPCDPQQIHIALSDAFTSNPATNNTIKVIFHTIDECSSAYISLKDSQGNTQRITATAVNYFADEYAAGNYSTYVHIFDFPQLEFSQTYEYSCYGSDNTFLAKPQGPFQFYLPSPHYDGKETKVLIFADMDHYPEGMNTINALGNVALNEFGNVSAFIHNGDMAYDLESSGGKRGDNYMKAVQKFAAIMPYMVTAGNHEDAKNFSNFNMRFQMPEYEESQNHFYSFNVGNMHFVSFNLDLLLVSPEYKEVMLNWLEKDLTEANNARDKQPWIIAYAHQPFYCSYKDNTCPVNAIKFAEFEDLLIKYKVDFVVGGHVHFYERMLPIKKGAVAPFDSNEGDVNYTEIINPQAPVYVLQGIAGHRGESEINQTLYLYKGKDFTVTVSKNLSYLSVRSQNNTHLLVENIRSEDGTVEDYFYIVKKEAQQEEPGNTTEPNDNNTGNGTVPNNTTEPVNNTIEPVHNTTEPVNNTTEPVNNTTEPVNNTTNPGNSTGPIIITKPDNITEPVEVPFPGNNTTDPVNTTEPNGIKQLSDSSSERNHGFGVLVFMCLVMAIFV